MSHSDARMALRPDLIGRRTIAYDPPVSAPVVVILAAGHGTRMHSATPKLLHPLCGWPMLAWPLAAARAAGAGKTVVVDGPGRALEPVLEREREREHSDRRPTAHRQATPGLADAPDREPGPGDVALAVQDQARGTADAVMAAAAHIDADATVIVLYGDVPLIRAQTIRELAEAHARSGAVATIATMMLEDPSGYGRVVRGPDGTVQRVVETKAPGDATELELHIREVNTGICAFAGGPLLAALREVRSDNAQGELYLPDVLPILRAGERSILAHEIEDPRETLGVNDRSALATVRALAQERIHERHMLAGVTIVDPRATVIDAGVTIDADTVIAPFSSLHGTTAVGARATIGPLTTLIDARVGDEAAVLHSYAQGAEIGDRARVGPFAYLRPGAVLRAGAKAGAFVEIKNSDIGRDSKVPHLSYIGDTDVGPETNIGAGTITANYDGYRKHRTTIGSRVKISVDTALIAPVAVGDEAYTAAGSVISKDVPPGALGVARPRQENIEGYAERRKEREAADAGDRPRAHGTDDPRP